MRFPGFLVLLLISGSAAAADRAMIILDASGSMWGQIEGKTKIEIARETLREVTGELQYWNGENEAVLATRPLTVE
jgi:Ca-activated chloride channel family protein